VFEVLNRHIDPGQVENVYRALPEEIRALWPQTAKEFAAAN
jgi:uncharacterized protein (DUF2267 family)